MQELNEKQNLKVIFGGTSTWTYFEFRLCGLPQSKHLIFQNFLHNKHIKSVLHSFWLLFCSFILISSLSSLISCLSSICCVFSFNWLWSLCLISVTNVSLILLILFNTCSKLYINNKLLSNIVKILKNSKFNWD